MAAGDMFTGAARQRLAQHLRPETLETPVTFTDYLPDDTIGYVDDFAHSPSGKVIYLNSRIHVDPEQLAHTAAEEMIHVERHLRGRDFDTFGEYINQAHEQSARRGTPFYAGFERPQRYGVILRDHPMSPGGVAGSRTLPESRLETGAANGSATLETSHGD